MADQLCGSRATASRPAFQARRGPLAGLSVRLGHVGGDGGMPGLVDGASMAGDAPAAVEAFNGVSGDAHLHLLFDKRVGHGVVMAQDLNVIIDMHPGLFPFGILVGDPR